MKCLSCGDNVCWVITKNTAICDKCGAEHTQEGLFWNCCLLETRAEKAESELNTIRDRIEAVTEEEIKEKLKGNKVLLNRKNGVLETGIIYDVNVLEILKLIKQIGGVK